MIRNILTVAALTTAALLPSQLIAQPAVTPVGSKPNVIVILADDLGYGDLGVYGGSEIPTPNLDALARSGVRFTDGYVTCPVCAPTRAALLTGRYQQRFGFETNPGQEAQASPQFGLPTTERTLAEKLKSAGYATAMFGKWHIGYRDGLRPYERGFDEFFGFLSGAHPYMPGPSRQRGGPNASIVRNDQPVEENEYLTDAFAREAVTFISKKRDEPYFVYLPFNGVHSPMQAPARYTDRFANIADDKRRTYAGMLTALDEAVGRVLRAVKESGEEQNTLVFFFSDNGGPTPQTTSSNGPLNGHKGQVLEGGIRVPFMMKWPGGGVPAGKVYDRPVVSMDIHATVLAAAGIEFVSAADAKPAPGVLDGRNLVPFVSGRNEPRQSVPHDALFWRFGNQWAVRKGDWKLLSHASPNARQASEAQLYNLRDDIGEQNDLASKMPEKVAELRAAYDGWNTDNIAPLWRRSEAGAGAGNGRRADRIRTTFDRLDTDKNGTLTEAEYSADAADSARRPFVEVDANKDGKMSLDEVTAAFQQAGSR